MPIQGKTYRLLQRTYLPPANSSDCIKSSLSRPQPDVNRPKSSQRSEVRKAAVEDLKIKLRTTPTDLKGREGDRHVTFEEDLPRRDLLPTHPAYRHRDRPLSGRAGDVTPIDHRIAHHGGSTSTLKCLPYCLRISKAQPATGPKERIEELQRENGHLRRELTYYKDTRGVLMKLFDSIQACHQSLEKALTEATRGVAMSEQRFVDYWAPHRDEGNIEERVF